MDFEKEKTEWVNWQCSDCSSRICASLNHMRWAIDDHKKVNHKKCEHRETKCMTCGVESSVDRMSSLPKCLCEEAKGKGLMWICPVHDIQQKPDAVEEKIKEIKELIDKHPLTTERLIRELVALARAERKD